MKKRFCDSCGKEIPEHPRQDGSGYVDFGYTLNIRSNSPQAPPLGTCYDLCQECGTKIGYELSQRLQGSEKT